MAFERVYTKGTKRRSPTATEYEVDVVRNERVTIRCTKKIIEDGVLVEREITNTFEMGDEAEYDSFNLKYTGEILSITPKTVSIRNMYGRTTRLSMNEFCWRNWDFDAVKVAEENAETRMYI
jgi:hypothetical protein